MLYRFDDYLINVENFTLIHNNHLISVEPAVLKTVIYLIENRKRNISRDELHSHLWNERCVSDSALNNLIKNARKLLGDDGNSQKVIKTIHSVGYRFVRSVDEVANRIVAVSSLVNITPSRNTSQVHHQDGTFGIYLTSRLISNLVKKKGLIVRPYISETCHSHSDTKLNKVDYQITGNYLVLEDSYRVYFELANLSENLIEWADFIELDRHGVYGIQEQHMQPIILEIQEKLMPMYLPDNIHFPQLSN